MALRSQSNKIEKEFFKVIEGKSLDALINSHVFLEPFLNSDLCATPCVYQGLRDEGDDIFAQNITR